VIELKKEDCFGDVIKLVEYAEIRKRMYTEQRKVLLKNGGESVV
jgi:hypothetical protein